MSKIKSSDSNTTKRIRELIKRIQDKSPTQDSLFELASDFFQSIEAHQEKLKFADQKVKEAEEEMEEHRGSEREANHNEKIKKLKGVRSELVKDMDEVRLKKYQKAKCLANDILSLIQGETSEEMDVQTARFLGTLQLISPTEGAGIAKANQKTKHLYKAVLCVRLLHLLLDKNLMDNEYVNDKHKEHVSFMAQKDFSAIEESPFRNDVEIPLVIAAICQDIGHQHPDAQEILVGPEGDQDEFRMLEKEDRNSLLKIGYTQSLKFVTQGLGMEKYVGNSKEERDAFHANEKEKLHFLRELLKAAVNPEDGIGNILKIPQVYCSVIMSTKANYSYDTLPRAGAVMDKGAEVGAYSKEICDEMMAMLGLFPQGFGVAYIPKDSDGKDTNRYEYAVVNGLFPQSIDVPICRIATRSLTFTTTSINNAIGKANNLYYANTRKKLERIDKKRLEEILRELSSNYKEGQNLELIPKCWHPRDFFENAKSQNLWNKAETYRI